MAKWQNRKPKEIETNCYPSYYFLSLDRGLMCHRTQTYRYALWMTFPSRTPTIPIERKKNEFSFPNSISISSLWFPDENYHVNRMCKHQTNRRIMPKWQESDMKTAISIYRKFPFYTYLVAWVSSTSQRLQNKHIQKWKKNKSISPEMTLHNVSNGKFEIWQSFLSLADGWCSYIYL